LPVERLSDLSRAAATRLKARWPELPRDLRLDVVRSMLTDSETQVERSYARAMLVAFDDPDSEVRLVALDGLWELDTAAFLESLLGRVSSEDNAALRASEVEALSRFALQMELGKLDQHLSGRLRTQLLASLADPVPEVRGRALEAAGYLANDSEVTAAIDAAFRSGEPAARVSALRAMGRQADARWVEAIGQDLASDEPEMRYEAAKAAGENGDPRLAPALIDLTDDDDLEVQLAAVTSLGQIGGGLAINALRRVAQNAAAAVAEAAQEALDGAYVTAGDMRAPQ